MGKKVKEYKSGDFIFAKVKGYPAWPARVQKLNGKKYFVYFYGTGETANLPPNMIFDYVENKDKFLTKTVKRRDFNDGVKQIEHDFANKVPLEQVIGAAMEVPAEGANDTANDTGNDTMEDSAMDTTTADDTVADTTAGTQNAGQNDTAVEDSDEAGALVIDEGKAPQKQQRKSKAPADPPKTPKTPKTLRGKAKKDDKKEDEEDKPDEAKEEIVSRSGRKIRPKRYIDEQTEENTTLPSPAPKKRRGASPPPEKAPEKEKEKEKEAPKEKDKEVKEKIQEKNMKHFNNVPQLELEDLKEPFKPADAEKENILIAYLPSGQYCGIKLFQSRPATFKDEAARLQWDKQAASNAVTLKSQLERGQITAQSIIGQLVMDLNLTDEEKASLDKERETEEKKSRVQFLKTEMKLIELDARIKTCLCLEKADVETCLKLLDELMELDVKPLMLLKHPCCVETVKRMRAYVGNAPRWQLSEPDALQFAARAHLVRKQADTLYKRLKELFSVTEGLSFWEFFSSRVTQFQAATANLSADQLLEMVHEPAELSQPSAVTMQAAVEAANKEEPPLEEDEAPQKKKNAKAKKANNNSPAKQPPKRQSSRSQKQQEEKEKEKEADKKQQENDKTEDEQQEPEEQEENDKKTAETNDIPKENADSKEKEVEDQPATNDEEVADKMDTVTNDKEADELAQENDQEQESEKTTQETPKKPKESEKKSQDSDKKSQDSDKKSKDSDKKSQDSDKKSQDSDEKSQDRDKKSQDRDKKSQDRDKKSQDRDKKSQDADKSQKKSKDSNKKLDSEKKSQENDKEKSSDGEKESNGRKEKKKELEQEKQKEKEDEPRAKRSRGENKKTDPPPRSPAKRKSKA